MRLSLLSATIITAIGSGHALANQDNIEKIDVWGTSVKSSSVYLGDEDIASKQADHLSDLLRSIPGVEVGGTHSTNQRINIRGLSDTSLQITLDGATQNANMFHHFGNLLINPDILKSVDIQVGSNSVVYGGLGGSVEFETKDAKDLLRGNQQFGSRAMLNYQSNAAKAASFTAYGQLTDRLDFLGYAYFVNRDNVEDGEGVEAIGNDGDNTNILAKFGFDINSANRIELRYDSYVDEGDYNPRPDLGATGNEAISGNSILPTEYTRDTLTLGYELNLGDSINLSATAFTSETELHRDNEATRTRPPVLYSRTGKNKNSGLQARAQTVIEGQSLSQTLTYGLEYNKTETRQFTSLPNSNSVAEQATLTNFYIEDRINFGQFTVTPGVRTNKFKRTSTSGQKGDWSELVTALAAETQLGEHVTATVSTSGLFEAPPLGEIFTGNGQRLVTADDLEPVTGRNNEIAFKYSDRNVIGAQYVSASIKRFESKIDNYFKQTTDRSTNITTLSNATTETNIDGWEASFLYQLGNFDTLLTYSATDADQPLGEPNREFGHRYGLGFNYYLDDYGVTVNWHSLFVQEEKDFLVVDNYKPAYNVHNVSLKWLPSFAENMNLTIGIDNIFDRTYASHASRVGEFRHPVFGLVVLNDNEPGRNIKLSASYTF